MDYYLEDRSRLNGQPKATIADYVESCGLLVPRRFATIAEARASGAAVLCRSEHEQDYDGASGLTDSFLLSKVDSETTSFDRLRDTYFSTRFNVGNSNAFYKQYCAVMGIDIPSFEQKTSFSLWEVIPGYNRSVVADNGVENLFHVLTYLRPGKGEYIPQFAGYSLVDSKGIPLKHFGTDLASFDGCAQSGFTRLIEAYESVRKLPRFNQNHAPLMEFQTNGSTDYFLQYLRCRDFSFADFTLDCGSSSDDAIEMSFVRGSTSKEGMIVPVSVYYGETYMDSHQPLEQGSFDFHYDAAFTEAQVRTRSLQTMVNSHPTFDLTVELLKCFTDLKFHAHLSKLFKPAVSAIFPRDALFKGKLSDECENLPTDEHGTSYINVHVVSDGRRAFLKRVD